MSTIAVSKEVKAKLASLGSKSDTYEKIIMDLIEKTEGSA